MKFELNYRDKGEKHIKEFEIDFVPNGIVKKHTQVIMDAGEVTQNFHQIQNNENKIVALRSLNTKAKDKEEKKNNKEEIAALTAENKRLALLIAETGDSDYFDRRFDIIKTLFEQNGITDEKFLSYEFWDNCVDYTDLMRFLRDIVEKDVPKKKAT